MNKYFFLFILYHLTGLIGVYSQSYTEDDIIEFTSNNSNNLTDNDNGTYNYTGEIAFEIPVSDLKTLTVRFLNSLYLMDDAELYLSTTPIDPNNLSSLVSYSYQVITNSDLTF